MSHHLIQPSRIIDGKRVKARHYSARIKLESWPRYRTIPLRVTDKRVAQQKLAELVTELEREAAGIGVSRGVRDAMTALLETHVARFLADVKGKGRAHSTVKRYRNLLRILFRGCGWKTARDVSAESFSRWRVACGHRPKYINDLLSCAEGLFRWMERNRLLLVNPLQHVEKTKTEGVGAFRRALSADEVSRLLKAAPASRAWVYLVILYTGLRRHELNRLNWGHFHLDADPAFVELPADLTKNRKADRQPLRVEVVAALRAHMPEGSMPFEWVFRGKVPSPAKLRKDLAAAGIPAVDERGRCVDVHALRTTFGTMLSVAGVAPRVAMELMRHSDLKLTMRVYTDAGHLPLAQDVLKLPAFSLPKNDAHLNAQRDAQTAVAGRVEQSEGVAEVRGLANGQVPVTVSFSPAGSLSVATGEDLKMVGAVRFELTTSTSRT